MPRGRPRMIGPRTLKYTRALEKKNALAVATTANSKANSLLKRVEKKYFDNDLGVTSVDSSATGTLLQWCTPSQGNTAITRVGDTIHVDKVEVKLEWTSGTTAASTIRFIVLWDKDVTIGNANQILKTLGTISTINSQYNYEYRKNYEVLMDRRYILDTVTKVSGYINKTIKINKNSIFSGAGGATVRKGTLRFLAVSDIASGAAATDKPNFILNARTFYTD